MPSLERKDEKMFLIRIIEWGLNHPEGFGVSDITEDAGLALSAQEKDIIRTYLQTAYKNNSAMAVVGAGPVSSETLFLLLYGYGTDYLNEGNKYVISLEAQFNFIDYLELKFARENAAEAKKLSHRAIGISAIALIVPILVAAWMVQDVKIDDQQMNALVEAVNSLKY